MVSVIEKPQKLTAEDIPSLVRLSESVGWDYTPQDMQIILNSGTIIGHKTYGGQVVSSAAIFPYGNTLASIGVVITHPDYRGLGLAKEVMRECVHLYPTIPLMLIATSLGQPLYERIGFKQSGTVHKFLGNRYMPPNPAHMEHSLTVCQYEEKHWEAVLELDKLSLGANREVFLSNRIRHAKEKLILVNESGNVEGFGISLQGPEFLVIGPIVAPNMGSAMTLIHHLCAHHQGKVRIDVPSEQEELIRILPSTGFACVNVPPIMLLNADRLPERNGTLFGIASQAFG